MANIDTIEGLITEARHFWNVVKGNPTAYQVTQAQADELDDLTTAAETTLAARTAAENNLTTARGVFKAAFGALAPFFRALRQSVKENPATTNPQRDELHLTTVNEPDLSDGLATAPLMLVQQTGNLTHTIYFYMTDEEPKSKKKPNRVENCKIYCKIGGTPPTSIKECALIATDSKAPYVFEHEPEDIGKQAHYIGVWADKDDNTSPRSAVFSITITG